MAIRHGQVLLYFRTNQSSHGGLGLSKSMVLTLSGGNSTEVVLFPFSAQNKEN